MNHKDFADQASANIIIQSRMKEDLSCFWKGKLVLTNKY